MITLAGNIFQKSNMTSYIRKTASAAADFGCKLKDSEWDICYKYCYPYNILCNFTSSFFKIDGNEVNSMEGFLQSLKTPDIELQKKICKLPGFMAKKIGNYLKKSHQFDCENLYWNGKTFKRDSQEYQDLLKRAYKSKFDYDKNFRLILKVAKNHSLSHKMGKKDIWDTVLTEEEFMDNLNLLKSKYTDFSLPKCIFTYFKNNLVSQNSIKAVTRALPENRPTFINGQVICGYFNDNNLAKMRKLKVKNIIDIDVPEDIAKKRKQLCDKNKIKYINVQTNFSRDKKRIARDIQNVTSMYNSGEFIFISCKEKKKESNYITALNYLYNANATDADALLFGTPRKAFIKGLSRFYNSLHMGGLVHTSFDEEFKRRQNILFKINE